MIQEIDPRLFTRYVGKDSLYTTFQKINSNFEELGKKINLYKWQK